MTDKMLVFGGEIKALGNGKVGGYLVRFTDASTPDLEGDYFAKNTDFGIEAGDRLPVYYNHGLDSTIKNRRIGRGTVEMKDAGVWLEAQLEMRDEYEQFIYQMVEQGKVGWSSGSLPHLIEREEQDKAYFIKSWPLGEASITPTPAAGPILTAITTLKTWSEATQHLEANLPEAASKTAEQDATVDDDRARAIRIELDILELQEN